MTDLRRIRKREIVRCGLEGVLKDGSESTYKTRFVLKIDDLSGETLKQLYFYR